MTETAVPAELDGDRRDALTQLVVRGMHRGELSAAQQELVDAGLALARGPVLMPTEAGRDAVAAALRLEAGSETEQKVYQLFTAFLPVNRQLREVCTDWQRKPDGSANDHTDAAWDAAVRDRLDDVDTAIGRVLRRLSAVEPRLGHYREELTAALEQLDAGDPSALTSPLSASYHNVWMWLHQELLLMLGISRAEDEALEEQLVRGQSA
ncbi:hypothetical protein [Blastococcus sp. SYSU D00820]